MENQEWTTGTIQISLYGEPVEMEMTVPAKPVKPSRMLPIFQALTNSFVELGVGVVESEGRKTSCKAGCSACCNQPVTLAEMEAYQIAELVENLPEPRRSEIKRRFAQGVKRFRENKWFEKMENYPEMSAKERQAMVLSYFYEGVPCPFVEEGSCSIHPDRPLSCREYLVTSPAEYCSNPVVGAGVCGVKLSIKPSRTLLEISPTKSLGTAFFVPMIRALEYAETFPDISVEKTGN
jgi:Fe-S-cluster containining protein